MLETGDQLGENVKAKRPASAQQNNATAVQGVLDSHGGELQWLAEVMTGSRQAGEICLSKAIKLAEAGQCVGQQWMHSWVKRLLVHVAIIRISGEIREILPRGGTQPDASPAGADARAWDRVRLCSIPPQRIVASLNALERSCFILRAYLGYPLLDCALLLGYPLAGIESICARVLTRVGELDHSTQHRNLNIDVHVSLEGDRSTSPGSYVEAGA
jgi:DNA-directed RNA polymerase specialized sigma24 family protein